MYMGRLWFIHSALDVQISILLKSGLAPSSEKHLSNLMPVEPAELSVHSWWVGAPVPLHHLKYDPGQPLCDELSRLVLTVPSVASMVVVLSGDKSLVWGVQVYFSSRFPIYLRTLLSERSEKKMHDK